MGLGLLLLVSVGKENIYLSIEPEITFFKIAYKKHTNYSIEPTAQYFKTTPDFSRRCTVNIAKSADLIGMIYLYVQLPSIQLENIQINNLQKKFAWVNKIGLTLINFVEIELGGTVIDRHYGDWLNIWNELTVMNGQRKAYNKMIGNTSELIEFSINKNKIGNLQHSYAFCDFLEAIDIDNFVYEIDKFITNNPIQITNIDKKIYNELINNINNHTFITIKQTGDNKKKHNK